MTCYNCGYKVSVVSKDDIGWLCEWCSDHELRNPIITRLMESGYVLSKFDKNKTYSQTEMMYIFEGIIKGDEEK